MKKSSKWLLLLVLFVLYPKNVDALLCENTDKVRYQEAAKNIVYSYDTKESNGKIEFVLTFSNVPTNLALMDTTSGTWYFSKGKDISISGLKTNTNYRYDVFAIDDKGCNNIALYTFNIVLPNYNKYYSDPLCTGVEEYKLCQKWANINYSYEEWKLKVQAYKESLNPKKENPNSGEKELTLIEKIVDIYSRTYYIVFPIIIIVSSIWIYLYNKKRELF